MNKITKEMHEMREAVKRLESAYLEFIRLRLGVVIHHHQLKDLQNTILSACQKFAFTPAHYLEQLKHASNQSPWLDFLIAGITVGETYFFRDKQQMLLLEKTLLPELIKRKRAAGNLSLRIWSAGSATGEEIYTIAMMLVEQLSDLEHWNLNLLGTDINTVALQKAIAGIYSEWSMRSISDLYKNKYFTKHGSKYLLAEKIKDLVRFDYLNLNEDSYPAMFTATNSQDLILCRNVLIYFDGDRIARLMQHFYRALLPGGNLILGASDPVDNKATDLVFHYDKGMLFSRPMPVVVDHNLANTPQPISEPLKNPRPLPSASVVTEPKLTMNVIKDLIQESKWSDVLQLILQAEKQQQLTAPLLNAKATALANLGKLAEAAIVFQKCLSLDPTDKYSYFTYALTLSELNQLENAEKALRKTLFLDHDFVAGHYQLGLLLIKTKKILAGIKCLQNALAIVKKHSETELVPGRESLSYGRLGELLAYEIALYAAFDGDKNGHENPKKQKA